jgi:hypothetical protein
MSLEGAAGGECVDLTRTPRLSGWSCGGKTVPRVTEYPRNQRSGFGGLRMDRMMHRVARTLRSSVCRTIAVGVHGEGKRYETRVFMRARRQALLSIATVLLISSCATAGATVTSSSGTAIVGTVAPHATLPPYVVVQGSQLQLQYADDQRTFQVHQGTDISVSLALGSMGRSAPLEESNPRVLHTLASDYTAGVSISGSFLAAGRGTARLSTEIDCGSACGDALVW